MAESIPIVRKILYQSVEEGQREELDYKITEKVYEGFLASFLDHSPVHVDEEYARSRGFEGRVMHGAILNGFVSHFIGTWFPGKFSLLNSVDLRFVNPCYLGDHIHLETVVTQKMSAKQILLLNAKLFNVTQNQVAARGRIQVMVLE